MLCTMIGAILLSINIQVGLNMHLYDDIEDASSSFLGSTSSCSCRFDLLFPIRELFILQLHLNQSYQVSPHLGANGLVFCELLLFVMLAPLISGTKALCIGKHGYAHLGINLSISIACILLILI